MLVQPQLCMMMSTYAKSMFPFMSLLLLSNSDLQNSNDHSFYAAWRGVAPVEHLSSRQRPQNCQVLSFARSPDTALKVGTSEIYVVQA